MQNSTSCNLFNWKQGTSEWLRQEHTSGQALYYVNFMFHPLVGDREAVIRKMTKEISKTFYGKFCSRFVRNTKAFNQRGLLPRFFLFPDRQVTKCDRQGIKQIEFNHGGLHYNGFLSISPRSRFKENPVSYIQNYQRYYCRDGLRSVWFGSIDVAFDKLSGYATKTLLLDRLNDDETIVLPKVLSELTNSPRLLPSAARQLRDIQSRQNLSDETALSFLNGR